MPDPRTQPRLSAPGWPRTEALGAAAKNDYVFN
jgi:hypothetical protein